MVPARGWFEGRQPVAIDVHNDTDTPELVHWHGQMIPSDVGAAAEEGTPFVPSALSENARGEWTAVTATGIELRLGRGAPTDAVARLAGPVRMALTERLQEVAYVDLHYVNGFAVGWRDGGGGLAPGTGPGAPQDHVAEK